VTRVHGGVGPASRYNAPMTASLCLRTLLPFFVGCVAIAACGGSTDSTNGGAGADASESHDGGSPNDASGAPDGNHPLDSGGSDATSFDGGGRVPAQHRPSDSQCGQPAPAGNCTLQQSTCTTDGQCTSGTNGRCVQSTHGAQLCSCTYDACAKDTDCPSGKLCVCHGSAFTSGAGNTCIEGNCRVDADCGAGSYCSPSHGTTGCGAVTGYYCHTAADTCLDDSDCGGSTRVCGWSPGDNHWKCQQEQLCP
jgi:hypothetical protein